MGDNTKAARVIIEAAENPNPPFRLLLGSLAVKMGEEYAAARAGEVEKWKALSIKTDADR